MKAIKQQTRKYRIPQISAWTLVGYAEETEKDVYIYNLNEVETAHTIKKGGMTYQEDCPIFFQAMCVLHGSGYVSTESSRPCDDLADVLFFMDFSGIFDRQGDSERLADIQKKAESMFRPDGVILNFGSGSHRYLAFERSASMSRESKLSFIREDFYESLRRRMMVDMDIGICQLSKLYAYNGLMFTTGTRIEYMDIWDSRRMIVVDNPKTSVPDVDIITVEDDGSDGNIRKYTRVEKKTDLEVLEFDGEGLISPRLAELADKMYCGQHIHSSFQIRMPYIKGVVHEVDFGGMLTELGVPYIVDIWGEKHPVGEVDMILTKSQFKGFGWMTECGLSWDAYLCRCKKYRHALYISGVNRTESDGFTELNYQFLNTLPMRADEFRPRDLSYGWTSSPEADPRHWITKATETAYYNYVANPEYRLNYFLSDDSDERQKALAAILRKNPLFLNEPIYADELQSKADKILEQYAKGRLLIAGDNRYLSGDLMRFISIPVSTAAKTSNGFSDAALRLNEECSDGAVIYAPGASYPMADRYTLLRNPHIARNEEAVVRPMKQIGYYRQKYLSHLSYVVMVDSRTLIPERLGGADFDGDMVKTIADPLLNKCVSRNYTAQGNDRNDYSYRSNIPLLKIPSAGAQMRDANDWQARLETVRNTFSSRVGQICNAALDRSMIAYDENSTAEERKRCREETETLAILTGLEIDSAKSGVKPDLTDYIGKRQTKRNLFLKYKNLIQDNSTGAWYEPTTGQKLRTFFRDTAWEQVSSNVERLPYLAYRLEKDTPKASVIPAPDERLFAFAQDKDWKKSLDPQMTEQVKALIADYKEMIRRVSVSRMEPVHLKRKGDIERILFSRGQEKNYSADALYHIFINESAERIAAMRQAVIFEKWHSMDKNERERFLTIWMMPEDVREYGDLLMDFRHGGYRVLGDIICDLDDMYKAEYIHGYEHLTRKGDSMACRTMHNAYILRGVTGDYKTALAQGCRAYYMLQKKWDPDEVLRHVIALGERRFAFDVLLDRIEINAVQVR